MVNEEQYYRIMKTTKKQEEKEDIEYLSDNIEYLEEEVSE